MREYPQGELAAQVLGYVGEVPERRCSASSRSGATKPATRSGWPARRPRSRQYLRGEPRRETIEVDPTGHAGRRAGEGATRAGRRQRVSHDRRERADAPRRRRSRKASCRRGGSRTSTSRTSAIETFEGAGGRGRRARRATTVRSSRDASYPDVSARTGGSAGSARRTTRPTNPAATTRCVNRATQGMYAPGSTFKLVTSLAMTKYGIRSVGDYYDDKGKVPLDGTDFHNAQRRVVRPGEPRSRRSRSRATRTSTRSATSSGTSGRTATRNARLGIQNEARELGFGAATGFELDEATGRVPDPAWKSSDFADANYKTKQERDGARHAGTRSTTSSRPSARATSSVTPLQLANVYAAFANGGTLWQPHIESKVVDADRQGRSDGATSKAIRHVVVRPDDARRRCSAGFQGAVARPEGHRVRTRSRASRSTRCPSRARPAPRR